MRPLSRTAAGGTAAAGVLVAGGLVVVGTLATSAALVVTDPLAPRASADALTRFDDCTSLLRWYVDHAVDEVGPYGWYGPALYAGDVAMRGSVPMATDAMPQAEGSSAGADARASSDTGTNTQEVDVDEPDLAKTDGRLVVRLVDQRTVVITDVTGVEPRELGRMSLPVDAYGGELLLVGDHVLITQATAASPMPAGVVAEDSAMPGRIGAPGGTRVIDVDISDPALPRIAHDDTYTGQQVSLRRYGDVVRLVTTTSRPQLPWATLDQGPGTQVPEAEATRRNRALVRATTIEDWLPSVVDNLAEGRRRPLLDCRDVYHPADWSGAATTAVTTYDVRNPAARRSVAVTTDGEVAYSSTDRLYVTTTRLDPPVMWPQGGPLTGPEADSRIMPIRPSSGRTALHAFALDGTDTRYVGSGHVDGTVRDRWSLDEHDSRLRVAWTSTDRRGRTQNGVTVLAERNGALVPTGTVDRLGLDENIQSVRWFDDFAVLVTFRQVDPLYTIDLRDQDRPRQVGRLKVPGYSGYLHPIGGSLLLGLGVDATDQGQNLGAQAAVFDIGDLADPRRVSRQGFGLQSALQALEDPRAFTWLPDRRTGVTSVSSWTSDRSRLVALHVTDAGALEVHDLATDIGWSARTLPLADGRIAVVDDAGLRVLRVD